MCTGSVHVIRSEQLSCVAPQVVDACLDLLVTFRRPVSESNDPLCSVFPVVLQLFDGFGGNARDFSVDPLTRKKGVALKRKRAEEELTNDGVAKMAVGLFEEKVVLEVLG